MVTRALLFIDVLGAPAIAPAQSEAWILARRSPEAQRIAQLLSEAQHPSSRSLAARSAAPTTRAGWIVGSGNGE
jgi:hypothetical protein